MKYPARQRAVVAALRKAREAAGLSQRQLSEKLREPPNWIQRIESLERRVDVAEFIAIAKAVGADAMDLFREGLQG
jgi:ribosome-binding protein aMBF1 (putative translation factor)